MSGLVSRNCAVFLLSLIVVFFPGFAVKRGRKYLRQLDGDSDHSDNITESGAASSSGPSRKVGGELQRVREREEPSATASESADRNRFYNNIKRRWAKGEFSSVTVQDLARDAVDSFSISPEQGGDIMRRLADAGTAGVHAKNLFRDISKIFGTPIGSPGMDWIEVPVKGNRRCAHPVFWPHKFFSSVANDRTDIWLS